MEQQQEQEKIPEIVHSSWHEYLQPLFDDSKMMRIKYGILTSNPFYPASKDIFKVFSMPLQDIRVCILGQDPYPKGEGIGLAFAVNEDVPLPASLKVIHNEVFKIDAIAEGMSSLPLEEWKTLAHWTEQGVFLLNTALTVEAFKPGSHVGYWQWFTKEIVKIISKVAKPIWLLWGTKAQSFSYFIEDKEMVRRDVDIELNTGPMTNMVLEASHPAAELYLKQSNRKGKTFTGCNHFQRCNTILLSKRQKPIVW